MSIGQWPADGLEAVPACPICGGLQRTVLRRDLTDLTFGVAPGQWTLYQCSACRSGWLDPRPDQATIGMAYQNYYTHSAPQEASRQKSPMVRRLHHWLEDYQNVSYGLAPVSPLSIGRWLVPLLPSLRAKARAKWRHLSKAPVGGGNLLDFGFGDGEFLHFASKVGWTAEGIDFDPETVRRGKMGGLDVRCCAASADLSGDHGKYDVITLSHVIEHMHDPCGLLVQLYGLLKPGGYLWLETPNLESCGAKRFGGNWRGLEPPRHLAIFNLYSLRLALRQAGFDQVRQYWHGMSALSIFAESMALERRSTLQGARLPVTAGLRALLTEVTEFLHPEKREFLTLMAFKRADPRTPAH